ncbi:MAG: alpha-L-fucosidase, partial [Clostridia bacterium]
MGFYAFIHFTINTFTGKEWGNGKENPKIFNPRNLDTDQWCQVIKSAGMKGVVLTAKHHDGFCIWQTQTTEHSVKNSSYKEGKGDVVKELSESCKKHGLKMGIYLSPWDRNSEYYGTDKYMDFYIAQLTELLSNYGDIFMLWLDGACGSHLDGKPCQKYD